MYNSAYDIGFEVIHIGKEAIPAELKKGLLRRIARMSDEEWAEACGRYDTVDIEDSPQEIIDDFQRVKDSQVHEIITKIKLVI